MKAVQHGKLFAVFALFFILGGMLFPSFISSAAGENGNVTKKITKENKNFKVSAEYGIDGFAVYDYPTVVQVTLECNENFTGILRVIPVVDNGQKMVAYGEDISLAGGEAKTFTFVPSALGNTGKVNLEILDEKNKVVYSETDRVSLGFIGNSVMVGVLSDDYSALNYFDGVPVTFGGYQGIVSTLELTLNSLQGDSAALSVLNYIIIDNFDTANLSDEQYEALKDWVNNGGVLILSLGGNYQNVLHKFSDDFITGTLGDLGKKDLIWITDSPKDATQDDPEKENNQEEQETEEQETNVLTLSSVDAVDFEFDGAVEMSDFSEDKTVYQKTVGAGSVVVLSYALGMEPITSYADKETIAAALIRSAAVSATVNMLNGVNYEMNTIYGGVNLAKIADNTRKPSVLLYGGLLLIYVILVGPVLYLILKAIKKREKIWIAIPITALLFTGCIYLTGFIYRVRKPIVNTFSIVTMEDGFKTERVYTDIICPKAQEYTVNIKDGYSGFRYNIDEYSYSVFSNDSSSKQFDYMIKKKNDGTEIVIHNEEAFDDNSFVVSKTSENDIGSIDYDLKCYTTGFEGTITNNTNYDLTNVVVNFEDHFYQAGNLKKGEQVTIDKDKLIASVGYGTFENIYMSQNNTYTDRNVYKNYQIDTTMENNFVNVREYNQGCIWAAIDSYEPDLADGSEVNQNGFGVLFQKYSAEYEDAEGVYYPNLDQMILTSQGDYDSNDGMLYNGDVTITYSFENYPGITTLEDFSFGNQNPNTYMAYANVYAYNAETGEYDRIFEDKATLSGDELAKYVNGNILILKYEMADMQYTYFMPRIIARGDK